jgi:hypothetical protein
MQININELASKSHRVIIILTSSSNRLFSSFAIGMRKPSFQPKSFKTSSIPATIFELSLFHFIEYSKNFRKNVTTKLCCTDLVSRVFNLAQLMYRLNVHEAFKHIKIHSNCSTNRSKSIFSLSGNLYRVTNKIYYISFVSNR